MVGKLMKLLTHLPNFGRLFYLFRVLFCFHISYMMNIDSRIQLWYDGWLGEYTFIERFHSLLVTVINKLVLVKDDVQISRGMYV